MDPSSSKKEIFAAKRPGQTNYHKRGGAGMKKQKKTKIKKGKRKPLLLGTEPRAATTNNTQRIMRALRWSADFD
jgi:hypothetical protein